MHARALPSVPRHVPIWANFVVYGPILKRACLLRAGVCQAVLWGRNIQLNQTLISMID